MRTVMAFKYRSNNLDYVEHFAGSIGSCCGMFMSTGKYHIDPSSNRDSSTGIRVFEGFHLEEFCDDTHELTHVKTKCGNFTVVVQHEYPEDVSK